MEKLIAKTILDSLADFKSPDLDENAIASLIEISPMEQFGDYSFPCFVLSQKLKKPANQIAEELTKEIKLPAEFEKMEIKGPYINFFINKLEFTKRVLNVVDKKYGKGNYKIGKILIEFPSPNTNKPLHLGHLMNMAIGESVARTLEFNGNKVVRANLNNDRGIHICKSMLAYQKWGENKTPKQTGKKSDHFVGDFYVMFNQKVQLVPSLETENQELLRKWEANDHETIKLWKKMRAWALNGFKQTYKLFGIKHDVEHSESVIYKKGKNIILEGLRKGIFKKNKDGAIVADLSKENLGEKVLLRADGTSIYITQDIYLAMLRDKKYHLAGAIYVVGNEQIFHFQVLFALLKKLGFKSANNLRHLAYGMIRLPEGKMKSREGTIVDADDIIEKVKGLAKQEVASRHNLKKKELESRSLQIALSAIKYALLKSDIMKGMTFNPKEAINLNGDTGPYLLYSYARALSLIKKAKGVKKNEINEIAGEEFKLIKKISNFPQIAVKASQEYNPAIIAHYAFELAQLFNEFYNSCPVIGSKKEGLRLKLVKSFSLVLKNALHLLGIETIEEM